MLFVLTYKEIKDGIVIPRQMSHSITSSHVAKTSSIHKSIPKKKMIKREQNKSRRTEETLL